MTTAMSKHWARQFDNNKPVDPICLLPIPDDNNFTDRFSLRKPETKHQAEHFSRYLKEYLSHGYCHTCASQQAYGRQHGKATMKDMCHACTRI